MRSVSPGPFQSTVASVLLDIVRGVAALLVCVEHWRYLFFIDYPELTSHRTLFFLPYALCTLGHQAVVIFFVLSGYLVGGHVLRALNTKRWSWSAYLTQRAVRLWIVLIPALLLGGLLDLIALRLHLAPALYAGLVNNHVTDNVAARLTWTALLGNMFFVQSILTPLFGSNGALWSLANEFWYYMLFPLGLLAIRGPYSIPKRFAMAIGFFAVSWFVGLGMVLTFSVWLLGVLLAVVPVRRTSAAMRWTAVALYCPLFVIASTRFTLFKGLNPDYLLGILTFGLLWVLLGAQEPSEGRWYVSPARKLAGFSYTLYLVHTPMLMFLTALLPGESRWTPTPRHLATGLGVLLFVIAVAYLVAMATEFRTAKVRDWAMQLLPKRSKPKPVAIAS